MPVVAQLPRLPAAALLLLAVLGMNHEAQAALPTTAAEALAEKETSASLKLFALGVWGHYDDTEVSNGKATYATWYASCGHLIGNATACDHGEETGCCKEDGTVQCDEDNYKDIAEAAGTWGMYKCLDCNTTTEYQAVCASDWGGKLAHLQEIIAGTVNDTDGFITLCPQAVGTCYDCLGIPSQDDKIEDQSTCEYKGNCTAVDQFGAMHVCSADCDSEEMCTNKGYCETDEGSFKSESDCAIVGEVANWTRSNFTAGSWVSLSGVVTKDTCYNTYGGDPEGGWVDGTLYGGYPMSGYSTSSTCGGTCTECLEHIGGAMLLSTTGLFSENILPPGNSVNDSILLADAAAGTAYATAYAANPTYYNGALGIMGNYLGSARVAALSSTASSAGATPASLEIQVSGVTFLPFPKLSATVKTIPCTVGGTCSTDIGGKNLTQDQQHVLVLEPINYANSDPSVGITFSTGRVSVLGGENHGSISFSTLLPVRIHGVENTGSVSLTGSADVFVSETTNTGDINITGASAALYDVNSSGTIKVTNANAGLWRVKNEAGGVVTVNGGTFTIGDSGNAGTINLVSGAVTAVIDCSRGGNTGTIVIGAAATGTLKIEQSCKGTITDNSGGGVTVTETGGTGPTTQPTPTPSPTNGTTTDDDSAGARAGGSPAGYLACVVAAVGLLVATAEPLAGKW